MKGALVLLAAIFSGASSVSMGAGFQLWEQNASGLGNAYAGQAAAAENASAMFYNAASMTQLPGTQFSASILALGLSIRFTDSGTSVAPNGAPVPAGGSNGGDAGDWNYVPSVFFSRQLSSTMWLGLGVSAPFGLKTQYEPGFIGRFQSQKTTIRSYDINPSFAYKVGESIAIGAGLSYQHFQFRLERSAFVGAETASSLDLSGSRWGWNVGALFVPAQGARVGISHRSGASHDLSGTVNLLGVPGFPTTATANVSLPATSSVALAQEVSDKVELLADLTYTHWSSIKAVPVVLATGAVADTFNVQFRDGWRIAAGANYGWSQSAKLKFGVAYDISPVIDQYRTTALPDNDRIWVGLGAKLGISKAAAVDVGYAHAFVPRSGTINQAQGVGVLLGQGIVTGRYKSSLDFLGVQYSHAF